MTNMVEVGERTDSAEAEAVLAGLWDAFEELAQGWATACAPGCHACCSDRVQATGLEARVLAAFLRAQGREDLLLALRRPAVDPAARPAVTMNALARLCLEGREPPAEPAPASAAGICPLLADGLCQAYAVRPLACRVMFSRRRCPPGDGPSRTPGG